jgi:hypothetical protein
MPVIGAGDYSPAPITPPIANLYNVVILPLTIKHVKIYICQ